MPTIISIIRAILLKPVSDVCKLISKIINAWTLRSKLANFCELVSGISIDDFEMESRITNGHRVKSVIVQSMLYTE